jgi:hypothetical protein
VGEFIGKRESINTLTSVIQHISKCLIANKRYQVSLLLQDLTMLLRYVKAAPAPKRKKVTKRREEMCRHVCPDCGDCSECCECVRCGNCDRVAADGFCSNCDLCDDCCTCKRCEGCDDLFFEQDDWCDRCNRCTECCICTDEDKLEPILPKTNH